MLGSVHGDSTARRVQRRDFGLMMDTAYPYYSGYPYNASQYGRFPWGGYTAYQQPDTTTTPVAPRRRKTLRVSDENGNPIIANLKELASANPLLTSIQPTDPSPEQRREV